MSKPRSLFAFILTTMTCAAAFAQYVWVDEKGVKQFSDTPPPTSVPKNHILKTKNSQDVGADSSTSAPTTNPDTPAPKQNTVESRNEDYNKRRAEQAEKEKKAADAQQAANEKNKNCERLKSYLRTLEAGVRISSTDSNGERAFLTDDQRAKEYADAKKASSACQ